MIKKFSIIFMVLISVQYLINAQDTNLEKVLKSYYKANGLDKLQKIKSLVMTGTITRNDLMPIKITKLRPNKYRMDYELTDLAAIQCFDGKTGWLTAPWTGTPKASVMDEDALKDIKNRADFEGLLFNYREKEHNVELAGKDTIEGRIMHKIKLTRKDGGIEYYFIDIENNQLVKRTFKRMIRNKEIEIENVYSDYRMIDGILFPFVNETLMNGERYSYIEFEKIELNVAVDNKVFSMPQ